MLAFMNSITVISLIAAWDPPFPALFTSIIILLVPASRESPLAIVLLSGVASHQYGMQHDAPIQTEHLALTKAAFTNGPSLCKLPGIASILTGRLLIDSRSPTSPHMPAFAQSMREHSILLWVNLPECHFLGLADQVGILDTTSLEVIGF